MRSILIIEDDPTIQKALSEVMLSEGYKVYTSFEADGGLEKVANNKPDLILLDLILPGKSGFEFLKEIKNSPSTSSIPVVILSNLGDEDEVRQGLKLGAVDFLVKADYDLNEVVKIIKKYFPKK
ncbi:MAG: response regulator [Candidatus Doudnabacteria bacterium CG10_big_fil_rev_8_21_14_0_10_41_10]|uniref:Response regulator n=1 Tax=Candidatus Doudnabacteria bacterium CG10_big_fil_rev_8_21_14_0_10_41_10 TaxID=1974551 RepID=A0A2H0VCF2_9BACT|nr:MAG: response regulator [Candidatus Doudnabacteria bacterium CG10_big_fil_rev_8_21_14_0_10_41_10]